MKWFKGVFNFYLDASVHVALAVFALVHITAINLQIPFAAPLAWFLFFATICAYNFIKYGVEAKKYLRVANPYQRAIQVFSFVAAGLALYMFTLLDRHVWWALAFLVILTGIYAIPVLPNAKNLRNLGGFKIFVVTLVWAVATVILPVLDTRVTLSWDVWVETFQRLVFVLILLIPFEIRDLKYDAEDLKTLPQRYGVARTKTIGAFLTLVFYFSTFLKDHITQQELLGKGVMFLLLGAIMYTTKRNQATYYSSFFVESVPLFWWGALVLIQTLI